MKSLDEILISSEKSSTGFSRLGSACRVQSREYKLLAAGKPYMRMSARAGMLPRPRSFDRESGIEFHIQTNLTFSAQVGPQTIFTSMI